MPATTDDPAVSKIISLRLPLHLERQLAAIAARESNSVSATARRLLSKALRGEPEADGRG